MSSRRVWPVSRGLLLPLAPDLTAGVTGQQRMVTPPAPDLTAGVTGQQRMVTPPGTWAHGGCDRSAEDGYSPGTWGHGRCDRSAEDGYSPGTWAHGECDRSAEDGYSPWHLISRRVWPVSRGWLLPRHLILPSLSLEVSVALHLTLYMFCWGLQLRFRLIPYSGFFFFGGTQIWRFGLPRYTINFSVYNLGELRFHYLKKTYQILHLICEYRL
jgi:hypothetical protein